MMNSKTENVILESYSEYFRVFMTRLEVENDTFYDQSVSFCVEVIKNMPFIKKTWRFLPFDVWYTRINSENILGLGWGFLLLL